MTSRQQQQQQQQQLTAIQIHRPNKGNVHAQTSM